METIEDKNGIQLDSMKKAISDNLFEGYQVKAYSKDGKEFTMKICGRNSQGDVIYSLLSGGMELHKYRNIDFLLLKLRQLAGCIVKICF